MALLDWLSIGSKKLLAWRGTKFYLSFYSLRILRRSTVYRLLLYLPPLPFPPSLFTTPSTLRFTLCVDIVDICFLC